MHLKRDESLMMLQVAAGDTECFDRLFNRHYRPLVHFLSLKVRDHASAEDLAQEAFLRVYRARERYQAEAQFSTWLYRIATNLAINWLRDNHRNNSHLSIHDRDEHAAVPQIPDGSPRIDERLARRQAAHGVRSAIATLPQRQRQVVILHKYNGLSYDEIALQLGGSLQMVRSLAFRAYSNLRRTL